MQDREPRGPAASAAATHPTLSDADARVYDTPHHAVPRVHLLSNGTYSVMLTAAGSGYSRWRDLAVTRWREDPTCDAFGSYVYLRDVAGGTVWSAGYQPVGLEPQSYRAAFREHCAEITRRDGTLTTSTEVLVAPQDDAELRHVSITNHGTTSREIELTTYAEVVLFPPDADSAHPAFSKMFVQTELDADSGVLLATRRPRTPEDPRLWVAHVSSLEGSAIGGLQVETDRARFLGRGRDLRSAVSVIEARTLSDTTGTVLDPVLALRRRVRIAPGETARVLYCTAVATSRECVLEIAARYRDMSCMARARALSEERARERLSELGTDSTEARSFQEAAGRVLYFDAASRAPAELLARNRAGASALWPHGISGDLPIVLARIGSERDLRLVEALLRAQAYWHHKCLAVDMVVLNDADASSVEAAQSALETLVRTAKPGDTGGARRGGVFALRADLLSDDAKDLLQTAARAIFVGSRGSLGDQLSRPMPPQSAPPRRSAESNGAVRESGGVPALEFFNGLGGFTAEGREYVIMLDEGQWTPAPWNNVIANAEFGFQASSDGTGTTWSINSQQNALTPWSNDPVSNAPAEVVYVRDEDSGAVWTPTPLPIRQPSALYVVRHGFGYTRYEHGSHGISLDLLQYVPLGDSVKIARLKITNRSGRPRRLSVTNYVDWVLANQRARSAPFVITSVDASTGALLARNPWSTEFPSRVAFLDMLGRQQSYTADRAGFIGRHGTLTEPAAILRPGPLSHRSGAGLDPCGALQTSVSLQTDESVELVFLLGQEADDGAASDLIRRYRTRDLDAVLKEVTDYWDRLLGTVQVKTPDRSMDIVVNGWLLYQSQACRVWARTGFYQASGAFGYRDQLQDVMALCVANPELAREHILRAASRQFPEGDVQHWWLPVSGKGVRTRVSDDRVWLPFVVEHYLAVTRDEAVLDEALPFLSGPPLAADAHEAFFAPEPTAETATLFEHCVRALDSSLAIGSHGLPLFGTGDWNDGMNRVGAEGRGESVWLGWFLYATLLKFVPVAERRGRSDAAAQWRKHAFMLQQSIEREAWDGDWYRRGYYDDGTPLGSVTSDECRIDAIAQSWGVISGGADPARAARAMAAVDAQLVNRGEGLIQLFTPPFDHTGHDPGYIKGYPPGLRENGGQYTHAATWTNLAFALLGDGDRAAEVFSLLNPINHAATRAGIHRYKVEPYVVCADLYSAPTHVGRGGWTWYTGSAGWMHRVAVEGILGIRLRGAKLIVDPCIPRTWPAFEITFRRGASRYRISVENPRGVNRGIVSALLDGADIEASPCEIALTDDGRYHYALLKLG